MILDAWEKIAEKLPMLVEYQNIYKEHTGLQEILVKVFADVLEFHQHAIDFFSGRGMRVREPCFSSFLTFYQP